MSKSNLSFPVKLAMMTMRIIPRNVSPDDTSHAAFFEPSRLKKLTQDQLHAAMHSAAHDRCVAEEANPFLELFIDSGVEEYFKDMRVLDFGCAFGGTGIAWEKKYATKQVSGFDVSPFFIEGAKRFAISVGSTADFRQGYGEDAPFADGSFDTIVAIDVFEHVHSVELCLRECLRMLAPKGHLIAIFPTFYHPYEHHVKVSRTPLIHWFFSGETIRKALNEILRQRGPEFAHFQAEKDPNYKIPDLNGITVRRARRIIKSQNWDIIKNVCYGVPRVGKRAQTPFMRLISRFNSVFAKIPIFEEICLDRVAVILQKR